MRTLSLLEMNFGNSCNLDCEYCFVKHMDLDPHIDLRYIRKAADWCNQNDVKFQRFRALGGEISIKIEKVVDFLQRITHKPDQLDIVTNGANFERMLELLYPIAIHHNIRCYFFCSIDKLQEVDDNRHINTKQYMERIYLAKQKYPEFIFHINCVTTVQTEQEMQELQEVCERLELPLDDLPFLTTESMITHQLCSHNCSTGLYLYKNEFFFCKFSRNFHQVFPIGNLENTLEEVLQNRDTKKLAACTCNYLTKVKQKGREQNGSA